MALTVATIKRSGIVPAGRAVIADVTFDGSYPAGGEPYTAAMFGLNRVDFLLVSGTALGSATTAYGCYADHTNSKLMLFNSNGAAPAALLETATANQAATVVRVMAIELTHV